MRFRRSTYADIDDIMKIIKQAQSYLNKMGIDQWQDGYPNAHVIEEDIKKGYSYILVHGEEIIATVAVSFDGEGTYGHIYKGQWLTDDGYAVMHRLAVEDNYKGLGISSKIIEHIKSLCIDRRIYSIKVDTHRENLSMQRMLEKNEFKRCGIIYLENGDERIAFEKTFKQ
ncbi:MAG: GNAT family N-acetyltransferase [Clostridiales bacterium]|nr:GNAT family N-acetyltransferase [Clostridiales bacterium]